MKKLYAFFVLFLLAYTCPATAQDSNLLKGTMHLDSKGHLIIGGCDTSELSKRYSLPIYVIDEKLVRENMQSYRNALKKYYPNDAYVYYATKAMMNLAICKIVEDEGLGLDVSSGGELHTAIKADFPMDRVILHGNNKSEEEIEVALEEGVSRIIIDNQNDVDTISRLAERGVKVQVLLRVKPGVHVDTHHYIETGTEDSKFGCNILDGSAERLIQYILTKPELDFLGLHCHIGSQILNLEGFDKAIDILADFSKRLKKQGVLVKELDFGGGLGVEYTPEDKKITIESYIQNISEKLINEFSIRELSLPKLMLEPGRSIIAEAGITLYKIGSVKDMQDDFVYAAVNGGISDNIRPALYQAKYHAIIANRALDQNTTKVKIVGKCCETGDILIQEIMLPRPLYGDILAVFTTGAYHYSMASNYNRLCIPGVLLVNEGHHDWIVIPQDYDDLIRNDCVPDSLKKQTG